MRALLTLPILLMASTLFAQMSYQDLVEAVDAGSSPVRIKDKIYEQGIVFEIDRKLLKQMNKEKQPDWLIDLLMDYDQPVYIAPDHQNDIVYSPRHNYSHWRWHRPFVGYGFWPSLYWNRVGFGAPYYCSLYHPFLTSAYFGALYWADTYRYGRGYYPDYYYAGVNNRGITRGRLTPNGVIVDNGYTPDRRGIRRGSNATVQTRSSAPRSRASSNNASSSRTRASSSGSSRTRASTPTRSRSSSSNGSKAVRRKN